MLKASATVMHLGKIDMVSVGSRPIKRPIMAVEQSEKVDAIITDEKISAACLLTSYNLSNKVVIHYHCYYFIMKKILQVCQT